MSNDNDIRCGRHCVFLMHGGAPIEVIRQYIEQQQTPRRTAKARTATKSALSFLALKGEVTRNRSTNPDQMGTLLIFNSPADHPCHPQEEEPKREKKNLTMNGRKSVPPSAFQPLPLYSLSPMLHLFGTARKWLTC